VSSALLLSVVSSSLVFLVLIFFLFLLFFFFFFFSLFLLVLSFRLFLWQPFPSAPWSGTWAEGSTAPLDQGAEACVACGFCACLNVFECVCVFMCLPACVCVCDVLFPYFSFVLGFASCGFKLCVLSVWFRSFFLLLLSQKSTG